MKKIEINELSDLIGNPELTEQYFRNYPDLKKKYGLPAVEACIMENLQDISAQSFTPPVMREWQDRGYTIETLTDIFPKGVIVPTSTAVGSIIIHTNDKQTYQHQFHCARHKAVPLKRKDEVYIIFPYTITGNTSVDHSSFMEDFLFVPIWDVIAVPDYLLSDPTDNNVDWISYPNDPRL